MSEQIITKRCCYCKKPKPLSEFHKNQATKDGYQSECMICRKAHRQTEKGKKLDRKCCAKYNNTKRGQSIRKAYRQSDIGKAMARHSAKNRKRRFPEQVKAGKAVENAIRKGKLPQPDTLKCHYCPAQAKEYHHHKGYAPEYWLDVIPVCLSCHGKTRKIS